MVDQRTRDIYYGSNGEATKNYYAFLQKAGPLGIVAMNLFRAQKCSDRAKVYRRSSHRHDAYDRKTYSLECLSEMLSKHADELKIKWGWKEDPEVLFGGNEYEPGEASWALYVDIPGGQVSFHAKKHSKVMQPYDGDWDGQKESRNRILQFCSDVAAMVPA